MLSLPIEKYFRYHPPNTPERKALHDRVNQESLELAKALIEISGQAAQSDKPTKWQDYESAWDEQTTKARALALAVCKDSTCRAWANTAIEMITEYSNDPQGIMMCVQQMRMFLNQGITIDELVLLAGE
jgi:hypothetical protein